MSDFEKPKDEFLITFADLLLILKKNKKKILTSALVFAFLGLSYGLTKPVVYEAQATFKDKGKSQSGINSSFSAAFFMLSDTSDSNASTILRSRKLIEDLIKQQHLQGSIIKKERRFPLIPFQKIKNNLLIEYALFRKLDTPAINDPKSDIKILNISYHDEIPKKLILNVASQDKFTIYDPQTEMENEGFFNHPYSNEGYSFTLTQTAATPVTEGEYAIIIFPLQLTAERLSKLFKIETDKFDKSLLKISYKSVDRQQAATNVNALMDLYQVHVECEHEHICKKQVNYLLERQKEMAGVLESMMQTHADELSADLSSTGFATSTKAMEFLAHSQQDLKIKLFTINLEIQRLEKFKNDSFSDNDVFSSVNQHEVINKIATEKRMLKQQADSLNLVLRNLPEQSEEFKASFTSQLKDIDDINKSLQESHQAIAYLQNNEIPALSPKLSEGSNYVYKNWRERLLNAKNELIEHPSDIECQSNWEHCKTGFASYLSHLNHYFNVYKRNIEERLAHQQAPLKEFQGINLNVAGDLYISYNKELSATESLASQHEFIYNQLSEPDFEISSLSTLLNDPLSLEMITRTSNIILALKDQDNRSSKEQERLNADLAIQKGFLKTHVEQSISLLGLRQKFLKEKIQNLQSLNLSLIQEQVSILENQIKEYTSSTLENLNREKDLIEKNLAELRMEMAAFPQKWAAEQMIDQQMEINKSLVEEISKLVESKNISNNLEKLQSAPVDIAYTPLHPNSPRLLLLTVFGAVAGSFLSIFWFLGRSIMQGIRVSAENLKTAGQQVCGSLSRDYTKPIEKDPLLDKDLETLRRLISFIDPQKTSKGENILLLLEGKGPEYALPLAELLWRKGFRTLILEFHFNKIQQSSDKGLLQYLEGKIEIPEIIRQGNCDKIESGGICRYANEFIGSQRFKDLLSNVMKQYDWIIISSSATPISAEAEGLLDLFPNAAITVKNEMLHELKNCLARANQQKNKIGFIMAQH